MKQYPSIIGIITLLLWIASGCDDDTSMIPVVESDFDLGEIYNLDMGSYRIYHVIDTTFNTSGPVVDEYYKKDELIGTSTDLLGREIYLIQSSRANVGSFEFVPEKVWTLYIPEDRDSGLFIERQEDNIRKLDMKYPVARGEIWDANQYNTLKETRYQYLSTDTTVSVAAGSFDQSIFILEKLDTVSVITRTEAYTAYKPGIGHIFRYDKTIITDGPNQEFNPDRSRIYQEELIEFQ